jgi:tripartite-type tricarboxylate transporter receptor subunit TctC
LANHLYNSAKRDGTNIGMFASSTLFSPLFGEKKARFEIAKFNWIGNIDQTTGTCTVWHKTGIKKFDDLFTRDVNWGASGPTSVNSTHARGFNALFGTRIKVINGYPGSTGVLLAMKRGEVGGGCGFAISSLKARRRQEWKSGKLVVIVQTGLKKHPELKGIPHIYDYAKSDADKKVLNLVYGTHILGRPVAAPPKLPKKQLKTLRTAFMATMKDKDFLAEAKRQHLPVQPWSGAEVDKIIAQFLSYPPDVVAKATKALEVGKIIKVKLKKLSGTITKVSKKKIKVKDGAGKTHTFKVSGRRSKVKIAGKRAKKKALKTGMSCSFRYFGEGDLAKNINCK